MQVFSSTRRTEPGTGADRLQLRLRSASPTLPAAAHRQRWAADLASWQGPADLSFTLENGVELLGAWFHDIALTRYEDGLVVTEAAPLVDYMLSGRLHLTAEEEETLRAFVGQELRGHGGALAITKDGGMFEAIRPA